MEFTEDQTLAERVAKFVKAKRIARGETQKDLAIRAFGSEKKRPWVTNIENGRPIGLFTLDKLLKALNSEIQIIEN